MSYGTFSRSVYDLEKFKQNGLAAPSLPTSPSEEGQFLGGPPQLPAHAPTPAYFVDPVLPPGTVLGPQLAALDQPHSPIMPPPPGGAYQAVPAGPDGTPATSPSSGEQLVEVNLDGSAGDGTGSLPPTPAAHARCSCFGSLCHCGRCVVM